MADPFVGEIRIFGFNFAPQGWAFCDGQLMSISQNTALFSLLGTMYGGNGQTNFALPNMQGNAPMHAGNGPGLTPRNLGESGGETAVTLTTAQTPTHTHTLQGTATLGTSGSPTGALFAEPAANAKYTSVYNPSGTSAPMAAGAISSVGSGVPHNNLQPYLSLNFCIALFGIYPPRS